MTPAEHAALSAQLARAIGYAECDVRLHGLCLDSCYVRNTRDDVPRHLIAPWDVHQAKFDYRDPSVAMGVLEWLMREHGAVVRHLPKNHYAVTMSMYMRELVADTLPEAIARAAIAVADAKRQQVEQNEAREVLQS